MQKYRIVIFLALLLPFLLISTLHAEEAKPKFESTDFLRITKKEGRRQPTSMDTAIVRFSDEKDEIRVDLVSAVHIGDKEYYEELNEIFKQYDAVLFEGVRQDDGDFAQKAKKKKEKKENKDEDEPKVQSIMSSFQSEFGRSLDLSFQLDVVDYAADNFVHADMTAKDFLEKVSERKDVPQTLLRILAHGLSNEAENEEMKLQGKLFGTLFAQNRALSLKRVYAKEMLNQMDLALWLLGGDDGSAIITDRNAAALKVLRNEIDGGKKSFAIFYGGAHLPEFAKSLVKDFGFKARETAWIVAWDLTTDRSARKK